jgi:hypothetical protein
MAKRLLDRRGERTHPKRHRTRKRSKRLQEMKRQKAAHQNAVKAAAQSRHYQAVRRYWSGEQDICP